MQQNIYHFTTTVSRNIIRSYARKKLANPGIQKRLNILTEKGESAHDLNVDEMESDFMKLDEVHRKHEQEMKQYHEKEKHLIVRQKYFKQKQYNFLTWNDKEQIRYLHESNPNEWSIEKLSEGFPALPEIIIKIIKGKWQKQNDSKKMKHDKAVEKNWQLLREGKLEDIPETLTAHLMKFSSRKQINLVDSNKLVVRTKNEKSKRKSEFSSIINSYKELTNSTCNESEIQNNSQTDQIKNGEQLRTLQKENIDEKVEFETSNLMQKTTIDKRLTTLSRLKENIAEKIEANTYVTKDDQLILKSNKTEENNSELLKAAETNNLFDKVIKNKHQIHNQLTTTKMNSIELLPYPEKIRIPKNKFKKGLTYKVNDCYYDDDGEFLYRVPGMN